MYTLVTFECHLEAQRVAAHRDSGEEGKYQKEVAFPGGRARMSSSDVSALSGLRLKATHVLVVCPAPPHPSQAAFRAPPPRPCRSPSVVAVNFF
ncbi:hypothetical protein E2C01_097963 [Portunus trituberculatus]|uniref:Uncharacterized protein n=1 Tax=Portunus trituberculatus TaxID=210409 RepID=A0A5B7KCS0_PORTR|nr:hypothetical protein [Portunus trituberculatus]